MPTYAPKLFSIVVIGGSSQVGAELTLQLSLRPDVSVTPVVWSDRGAALFRLCGVDHKRVPISDTASLRAVCRDADVVLDCTFPRQGGSFSERSIDDTIRAIGSAISAPTQLIYLSSIMALGMPNAQPVRLHRVPRTAYGALKRHAERRWSVVARNRDLDIFLLRLGQVHGLLQAVSAQTMALAARPHLILDNSPRDPLNIMFVSVLAESVVDIAARAIPRGLYGGVCTPQWDVASLVDFFKTDTHHEVTFLRERVSRTRMSRGMHAFQSDLPREAVRLLLAKAPGLTSRIRPHAPRLAPAASPRTAEPDFRFELIGSYPERVLPGHACRPADVREAFTRLGAWLEERLGRVRNG